MASFEVTLNGDLQENGVDDRVPCPLCGRKFISDRLPKHIEVCERQQQKKRKVFDSSKQRAILDEAGNPIEGTTIPEPVKAPVNKRKTKPVQKTSEPKAEPPKKSNWREQHEEFVRTVRAARGEKVDDDVVDPTVKRIPAGYVECPSCNRSFTRGAAERHIPWCKEQKAKAPRATSTQDALAKFQARNKYKAPIKKSEKMATVKSSRYGYSSSTNGHSNTGVDSHHHHHYGGMSSKMSLRDASPARKYSSDSVKSVATSRVKARLEAEQVKQHPKTPVMKFKEKFPNHAKSSTVTDISEYIQQNENPVEILKRPNAFSGPLMPRTVPGVRTGGGFSSPTRATNYDDDELSKLKTKLEEMYTSTGLNGNNNSTNKRFPTPPVNGNSKHHDSDNNHVGTRESTPGSSDGGSIPTMSRGNSSESGVRSGGLPRFCHQCGTKYPVNMAKYCYECGARRLGNAGSFLVN